MMDSYTVTDFLAQLMGGNTVLLQWVGVGVSAALGLMFVFMGIRAGFKMWAQSVVDKIDKDIAREERSAGGGHGGSYESGRYSSGTLN
jgi:hypothetical protein